MMIFIAFVVGVLASPVIWPAIKAVAKAIYHFLDTEF